MISPSASASKGRESVVLRVCAAENRTSESDLQSDAPPTITISARPNCKARAPSSMACSDDAQAEFSASHEPDRPNALAIVPETMLQYRSRTSVGSLPNRARTLRGQFALDRPLFRGWQLAEGGRFTQQRHGFVKIGLAGQVAQPAAALRMANEHGGVGRPQVERIEPGVAQGVGRHSGHQQVRLIDRGAQLGGNRVARGVKLAIGEQGGAVRIRFAAHPFSRIVVERGIEAFGGRIATAERPSTIRRQYSSRPSALGNRQPMPMMASGWSQ